MTRLVRLSLWSAVAALLVVTLAPAALAGDAKIHTVEGDVEKPVRTHGPAPAYPETARKDRIQGRVIAKTVISTEGTIESVEIVESLGEEFDTAVREVLKEWRFEPAKLDGEPVDVYYNLTFNFKLDGKKKEAESET
ncbi:MAG: energy transducer TonB [bacterium]|nr:energy transducer TonB [bacterium]